ncbi:MAG: glucosamine-6-phosphate deaminase [Bacillota bacterium]
MEIIIARDYDEMSKKAAQIIAEEIKKKPELVLGLATGGTPVGTYRELVRMYRKGEVDFSRVITFNLDEYLGLPPEDERSYHYYMYSNFFDHVNVKPENIHIPNGVAEDIEEECRRYDEAIKEAGGIDLQLLGIGVNGHIGFNEPGEKLMAHTHVTTLAPDTIKANARFFNSEDEVPRKAITVGLGTIMKAKKIVLLASGKEKAGIMAELLGDNAVSTKVPASFLLLHPDVTIVMDEEAAQIYLEKKGEVRA